MTDAEKGKFDIFGYEFNPESTIEDFKKSIASKFTKYYEKYASVWYTLNDDVAMSKNKFNPDFHLKYFYNGMEFDNILIRFANDKLSAITYYTGKNAVIINENGEKKLSSKLAEKNFAEIAEWSINTFGEPTLNSKHLVRWDYDWGRITPSNDTEYDNSYVYICYKR